jgi:hypothetical protein
MALQVKIEAKAITSANILATRLGSAGAAEWHLAKARVRNMHRELVAATAAAARKAAPKAGPVCPGPGMLTLGSLGPRHKYNTHHFKAITALRNSSPALLVVSGDYTGEWQALPASSKLPCSKCKAAGSRLQLKVAGVTDEGHHLVHLMVACTVRK